MYTYKLQLAIGAIFCQVYICIWPLLHQSMCMHGFVQTSPPISCQDLKGMCLSMQVLNLELNHFSNMLTFISLMLISLITTGAGAV